MEYQKPDLTTLYLEAINMVMLPYSAIFAIFLFIVVEEFIWNYTKINSTNNYQRVQKMNTIVFYY